MNKQEYVEIPWSIETTIENLKGIQNVVKARVISINLDGKADSDAKEVDFDFGRVISALEKQRELEFMIRDIKKDFNKDDKYSVGLVLELLESVSIGREQMNKCMCGICSQCCSCPVEGKWEDCEENERLWQENERCEKPEGGEQ